MYDFMQMFRIHRTLRTLRAMAQCSNYTTPNDFEEEIWETAKGVRTIHEMCTA